MYIWNLRKVRHAGIRSREFATPEGSLRVTEGPGGGTGAGAGESSSWHILLQVEWAASKEKGTRAGGVSNIQVSPDLEGLSYR